LLEGCRQRQPLAAQTLANPIKIFVSQLAKQSHVDSESWQTSSLHSKQYAHCVISAQIKASLAFKDLVKIMFLSARTKNILF
jgi:hypothetical protein